MTGQPPVPARLGHRPTAGGVVIPWGNVQLADGGADFRSHHNTRWQQCWTHRRCQACGDRLTHPVVLLCGPNQLRQLLFDEPPLHPECAVYTTKACPMVAGRRTHYADREHIAHGKRGETCPDPDCDCEGWVPTPGATSAVGGGPAHEWYAVYMRRYDTAVRPDGSLMGGACAPGDVLVVRLVSRPGEGRCWVKVPDWRDRYEPPDTEVLDHVG